MKSVKPPMTYKNKEGKLAEPPEYEDATDMGTITSIDPEGGIAPINYGEAKAAAQMMYGIMEKALEEGSISSVDLGNLQFPLSAVAMVKAGEGKDQVYLPRLQAKALLNKVTAEMFTKQVLDLGGTIELGTPGHKRSFNIKKLEGEYETSYKYYSKSPSIDIARMEVAKAAALWYPRNYIYSDVLQVEDPEGLEEEWYQQEAENMSPNLKLHRIIMNMLKLAEDGDEDAAIEAQILAMEMGLNIEQLKAGIAAKQSKQITSLNPNTNTIPLFGGGGSSAQAPPTISRFSNLPQAMTTGVA